METHKDQLLQKEAHYFLKTAKKEENIKLLTSLLVGTDIKSEVLNVMMELTTDGHNNAEGIRKNIANEPDLIEKLKDCLTSEDSELRVLGLETLCNLSLEETNRKALTEVEALEQHPIMQNKNLEQTLRRFNHPLANFFLAAGQALGFIRIRPNENPAEILRNSPSTNADYFLAVGQVLEIISIEEDDDNPWNRLPEILNSKLNPSIKKEIYTKIATTMKENYKRKQSKKKDDQKSKKRKLE